MSDSVASIHTSRPSITAWTMAWSKAKGDGWSLSRPRRRVVSTSGGSRVGAEAAQQRDEQQRLVLAVAETLPEHLAGCVRLVRAWPHLNPQVADLVLHEARRFRGSRPQSARRRPEPLDKAAQFGRGLHLPFEERAGPVRHLRPGAEGADLHARVRVEPSGLVVLRHRGRDVGHRPRVAAPVARLSRWQARASCCAGSCGASPLPAPGRCGESAGPASRTPAPARRRSRPRGSGSGRRSSTRSPACRPGGGRGGR